MEHSILPFYKGKYMSENGDKDLARRQLGEMYARDCLKYSLFAD